MASRRPGWHPLDGCAESSGELMLRKVLFCLTWPVRELVDYVRFTRRVRAMKRKDPFIY